ncbi:MAG: hypothetical protein PUE95_11330 [Lachnospiraceae bacterium]|nr:hypothetical protein [Lachnospiraceae bacterium]
MDEHGKKMIAPIVITILVIAYYVFYFGVLISVIDQMAVKLLFGIIPVLLTGVMIYVCVQRIHEIRKGEEDDLSQY